jgi:hypothetical protein
MQLKENEEVVKVLHHHYMAMFIRLFKIAFVSLPFYFAAYVSSYFMAPNAVLLPYVAVTVLFLAIMTYDGILYYKDRLIITNMRIIYVDWQGAFRRNEHEAELVDIQDIETRETGILSFFPFLDYGDFIVETASAHTIVKFTEAPDPEGIKHFIYHLSVKPNRIRPVSLSTADDKARQTDEATTIARKQ